jgi:putative lumazine-binding protein
MMKSRTKLTVFLLLAIAVRPVASQTAGDQRDLVRRAVLDYVEGFYEGDTAKLARSIRPEVFKYGFWIPRDSTRYQGERMPWPEFLAYANRVKTNKRFAPANAAKDITVYDVLDQTASAKLIAYWGVDYLLLAKYDGRWMITHVLWQTPPRM